MTENEPRKCESDPVSKIKEDYGDNFQSHLLEQYKMYVEMMDRVTERRGKTNTFYVSLLSGLLALLSLLTNKNNSLFSGDTNILLLAFSIFGIFLCYVWHTSINSYKELNSLKFKVIHEIESYLPFPCYDKEWKLEKQNNRYQRLTRLEKNVPYILAIPYIGLLIYSLYSIAK